MASKQRILERAQEIMKREKVDAEKAWALAVAELTLEDEKAARESEEKKTELDRVIKEGNRVVSDLANLKDRLEGEAEDQNDGETGRTEKTP